MFMKIKNLIHVIPEITLFLSFYALMVVVNALIQGVSSGYVMFVVIAELAGCFLMDMIVEMRLSEKEDVELTWYVSAALTVILMAAVQPVTAVVTGICYILIVLLYDRFQHRSTAISFSVITAIIVTVFLIFSLKNGKGFSMTMALCFMNLRLCRKWMINHPKLLVTLEMHDEHWKRKNCIFLCFVNVLEKVTSLILSVSVMRNGMLAIMENDLYHPGELITVIPVCVLILVLGCYMKERLTLSDMNYMEKEVIPVISGTLTGMIAVTCLFLRLDFHTCLFLGSCLIAMTALSYLLVGREKKHLKAFRVLLRPVSLAVMVMAFMVVYNRYDGVSINAMTCGNIMAMLLCVRMWMIHLEELM